MSVLSSPPRRRPTASPTTSSTGSPPACGRTTSRAPTAPSRALRVGHGLGQHVPDGLPVGALRRRQAVRPRPQPRRGVDRRAHADQERLDEGGLTWLTASHQRRSRGPRAAGPHRHHRRAVPLRVDDRPLRLRRPARVLADDLWAQYGNADPVERRRRRRRVDRRGDRDGRLAAPLPERLPRRGRRRPRERARLPHVAPAVRGRPGHGEAARRAATTTSCAARATAGRSAGSCSRSCGARRRRTRPATSRWSAAAGPQADGDDARAPSRSSSRASRCATGSWAPRTGAGSSRTACRCPRTPSTGAAGRPAARRC